MNRKRKTTILVLTAITLTSIATADQECDPGATFAYDYSVTYTCSGDDVIRNYDEEGWICSYQGEWQYIDKSSTSVQETCRTGSERKSFSVSYTCGGSAANTKIKLVEESGTDYTGCSGGSCTSSSYTETHSQNQGSCSTGSSYGSWSYDYDYCSGDSKYNRYSRTVTNYQGCSSGSCQSNTYTDYKSDYKGSCPTGSSCNSWNYDSWNTYDNTCSGDQPRDKQRRDKSRSCTNYQGCSSGSCSSNSYTDTGTDYRTVDDGSSCSTGESSTSWSGNLYCDSDGDVAEDGTFTDYQGCSTGSCTSTERTETRVVETCSDGCSSGGCVDAPELGLPDTGLSSEEPGNVVTESIGSVTDGDTVTGSFDPVNGVSQVDITAGSTGSSVEVSAENLGTSKPASISSPDGLVLGYREINVTGLSNSDISTADVTFQLNQSKLDSVGADKGDVSVQRFNDGVWESLGGSPGTVSNGRIPVEASTPGFSTFALTVERLRPSGSGFNPEPTLEADVQHQNNRDITVRFYNTESGSLINETVVSGSESSISTAEVDWSDADQPGKNYRFKAEVDDGVNTVTDTQSFRIVRKPGQPFNPWPPDDTTGITPQ